MPNSRCDRYSPPGSSDRPGSGDVQSGPLAAPATRNGNGPPRCAQDRDGTHRRPVARPAVTPRPGRTGRRTEPRNHDDDAGNQAGEPRHAGTDEPPGKAPRSGTGTRDPATTCPKQTSTWNNPRGMEEEASETTDTELSIRNHRNTGKKDGTRTMERRAHPGAKGVHRRGERHGRRPMRPAGPRSSGAPLGELRCEAKDIPRARMHPGVAPPAEP